MMKHYLLTWYGMTDLRAALGLDDTDGPVLSALKTAEYSDAVILAYTNPGKDQHTLSGTLRDEWEEWFTDPSDGRTPSPVTRCRRSSTRSATPRLDTRSLESG